MRLGARLALSVSQAAPWPLTSDFLGLPAPTALCLFSLPAHVPAAGRVQAKTPRGKFQRERESNSSSLSFWASKSLSLSRFEMTVSWVVVHPQPHQLRPGCGISWHRAWLCLSVHLQIRPLLWDVDGVAVTKQAMEVFHSFLLPPFPQASCIFYELKMSRENTPSWSICSWVRERYSLSMKFRLPSEQKARKNPTCGKWD